MAADEQVRLRAPWTARPGQCVVFIYGADEKPIFTMPSMELAEIVVRAVNSAQEPRLPNAVLDDEGWRWNDAHDVQLKPHGISGRWCARCGVSETTASLDGMRCAPIYAGQKPYGGKCR